MKVRKNSKGRSKCAIFFCIFAIFCSLTFIAWIFKSNMQKRQWKAAFFNFYSPHFWNSCLANKICLQVGLQLKSAFYTEKIYPVIFFSKNICKVPHIVYAIYLINFNLFARIRGQIKDENREKRNEETRNN